MNMWMFKMTNSISNTIRIMSKYLIKIVSIVVIVFLILSIFFYIIRRDMEGNVEHKIKLINEIKNLFNKETPHKIIFLPDPMSRKKFEYIQNT